MLCKVGAFSHCTVPRKALGWRRVYGLSNWSWAHTGGSTHPPLPALHIPDFLAEGKDAGQFSCLSVRGKGSQGEFHPIDFIWGKGGPKKRGSCLASPNPTLQPSTPTPPQGRAVTQPGSLRAAGIIASQEPGEEHGLGEACCCRQLTAHWTEKGPSCPRWPAPRKSGPSCWLACPCTPDKMLFLNQGQP